MKNHCIQSTESFDKFHNS